MALIDRLKDAGKTTNTIEGLAPEPERREPVFTQSATTSPAAKKPAGDRAAAYATEPEAIARSYYVEDRGKERRYFDDYQRKALAIRADDTAISSKREDGNTIRAMLTLAEARGWTEIKVSGTAGFKRETWIEAQVRGIAARGYKATDLDRQEADRRRAERGPNPTPNELRSVQSLDRSASPAPARMETEPVQQAPRPAPAPERAVPPPAIAREAEAPQSGAPAQTKTGRNETAYAQLSPDGKLFVQAMSGKIDRQMNRLTDEAKLELKSFMASELLLKERREGPVQLTADQRLLATTPEPERRPLPVPPPRTEPRRQEPEPPQRMRGR